MTRVTATFSVQSDRIKPDQITTGLAFVPDHTVMKGADRVPPRPVPKSYGWYVMSSLHDGNTVDEVISDLLNRLGNLHDQLNALRNTHPNIKAEFRVAVGSRPEKVTLYLAADTVGRLAKFGASLDIDFSDP